MNFMPRRPGPLHLLGLLTLILTAGLASLWVDEHARPRNLDWVAPKPLAPDIKVPVISATAGAIAANPAVFAVILERPIFAPDRRPPPPPTPPTPPPPPDPLANIQILGIFSGTNVGILARVDDKMRRIKINEAIGPWTLKSIEGREITFVKGEENRKLRLAYARIDTPVPQAPAADAKVAAGAARPPVRSPGPLGAAQNAEDETRERIRRLNEYRAGAGLPPLPN